MINFLIKKPKAKEAIRAFWGGYGISKTTRIKLKKTLINKMRMIPMSKLEITIEYCIP